MCFSSPPKPPAPPPPPPKPTDPNVTRARDKNRARAALAQGRSSTIATSGLGLTTQASTVPKTVLGA